MKKPLNISQQKIFLATFAMLLCCSSLMAQYVADYKRNADKFYAKGEWYSAAQYYEKYLEQKQKTTSASYEPYTVQGSTAKKKIQDAKDEKAAADNNEIVYRIAESFRHLNDYGKAGPYYAKAIGFDKIKYPLATYHYAVALRANGKYAEAEKQFTAFAKAYTAKDGYTAQTKVELANLKFIQEQLAKNDLDLYKVSKLGGNANSSGSNYAATFIDGGLVFTSSRADSAAITSKNKNPYINNLYKASSTEPMGGTAEKLTISATEGYEQGVASFTGDGKKMYYTKWNKKDGLNISSIYLSSKKDNTWSEGIKLGSNVNADAFNSKQPYVSADGSYIIYASDRSGGEGKFDLWYAPLNNDGEPGSFINLGKNINTKENEEAPFYNAATNSLVFASNGKIGMGGFDLYESKGIVPSSFGEAINLGYPVNSIKDDIYFTNKGGAKLLQEAVISTDRSSACCLELFAINKTYKKYVTGIVTDCKTNLPLADATLKVDANGKMVVTQNTSADGKYFFEVKEFTSMKMNASKDGYNNGSLAFGKPSNANDDTLVNAAFCLVPIEKVAVVDTTPVVTTKPGTNPDEQVALFDFAKYSLRAETAVMLDTLAAILKREKSLGLEIIGYTDAQGTNEYNLKLSQQRADACKDYLIKQGVAANKLKSTGKGECCPLTPDVVDGKDNPENRQSNRRVEFKVIFIR